MVQTVAGNHDMRQLELMLLMAKNKRLLGLCCSEKSLKSAVDIIDANDTATGDLRAKIYSELGDAYIASGKKELADTYYLRAFQTQPQTRRKPPQMIALSRQLDVGHHDHKKVYSAKRDSFFRQPSTSKIDV